MAPETTLIPWDPDIHGALASLTPTSHYVASRVSPRSTNISWTNMKGKSLRTQRVRWLKTEGHLGEINQINRENLARHEKDLPGPDSTSAAFTADFD